jgi:hypothetical protein
MRGSSPSILKLDKSLSHLRNLRVNLNITKMQNLYKCTEGVVAKLSQRRQSKQLQTIRFKNSLELMLCVIDISTLNKTYLI